MLFGLRVCSLLTAVFLTACATTKGPNSVETTSISEPFALNDSPALAFERLPDEEIIARTEFSEFGHRASELLFRAMSLLGTPYRYGGTQPEGGFDCSGFVGFLYQDVLGFTLPRTASAQSSMPAPEIAIDQLEPGDLVFFRVRGRFISHVGIYAGAGEFVHAPSTGGRVRIDQLSNRYWAPKIVNARRPLALVQEPVVQTQMGNP